MICVGKIARFVLIILSTVYPAVAGGNADEDITALKQRIVELEARAEQVDVLTSRVQELEGQVDHLSRDKVENEQMQARRYEALRQHIHEILADIDVSESGSGYGSGFDFTVWGWLSYENAPQLDESTFWAWEIELDITKTFTDRITAGIDIDFTDTNSGARSEVEQAFVSLVLFEKSQTLITFGKFNSPFGIEPRDFWDRLTGTTSLIFRARPRNLVGLMVTQPIEDWDLKMRPFVVNGFENDLDINNQPSIGLTIEYTPHSDLDFAVTNWYGPEFEGDTTDRLYFVLVQGKWYLTSSLTLMAEYIYGRTNSSIGEQHYNGAQTLVNYDIDEQWRVFARWSYLHDPQGLITGDEMRGHETSTGFAYDILPELEFRFEYRHDFINGEEDVDNLGAHVTFGF